MLRSCIISSSNCLLTFRVAFAVRGPAWGGQPMWKRVCSRQFLIAIITINRIAIITINIIAIITINRIAIITINRIAIITINRIAITVP